MKISLKSDNFHLKFR